MSNAHTCPTCGNSVRRASAALRWPEHRGAVLACGSSLSWRIETIAGATGVVTLRPLRSVTAEPMAHVETMTVSDLRDLLSTLPDVWRIIDAS